MEAKNNVGSTALYETAAGGHAKAVEILLNNGANMETMGSSEGNAPLTIPASGGHYEVVALLCQRGANLEAQDRTHTLATATTNSVHPLRRHLS